MNILCAHTDVADIQSLIANPKNPNKHSEEQIKLLAKIMKYQGVRNPIVVSKRSGFITKGHARLEAAKLNQWEKMPVDRQDYKSEADEYADMVADNKIAELAISDMGMIELEALGLPQDFDLELLGIPDFDLSQLNRQPLCDEDDVPQAPAISITKPGDLYILGNHKLLCGDATNISDVERLMGGGKASMVFTDPPYNINYEGKTKDKLKIQNDNLGENFFDFLKTSFSNYSAILRPGGSFYVCHADTERVNFTRAFVESGFHLSSVLIWVKNNATFGRQDYFWKHEPILYGWRGDGAHNWCGPNNEVTVWEIDRPLKSEEHPTMKPVALIERALKNSTKVHENVCDFFGGSGSTLLACEKLNRRCYSMELDPRYCDVIVSRWEKYTGQKAVRNHG